ncbi:MAG: hypothetical protein ACU833_14815 [Gammaproteobacteria bacterium]
MKDAQKKIRHSADDCKKKSARELPFEDERYPGSFFKIPGVPQPGKTGWRVS